MNTKNAEMQSLTDWETFDALTAQEVMEAALADPDAQPVQENEFKDYHRLPNFLDRVRTVKENKVHVFPSRIHPLCGIS
jgi:hypothetical protein